MKTSQSSPLYIDGFLLSIVDSAYLIKVEPANGTTGKYSSAGNLPDWIFHSVHAIWLTQDDAPLMDRAIKGDEIKHQIMKKASEKMRKTHE